jgi:hypothetical protein
MAGCNAGIPLGIRCSRCWQQHTQLASDMVGVAAHTAREVISAAGTGRRGDARTSDCVLRPVHVYQLMLSQMTRHLA